MCIQSNSIQTDRVCRLLRNEHRSSTAPACVRLREGPGSVAATELLCPAMLCAGCLVKREICCVRETSVSLSLVLFLGWYAKLEYSHWIHNPNGFQNQSHHSRQCNQSINEKNTPTNCAATARPLLLPNFARKHENLDECYSYINCITSTSSACSSLTVTKQEPYHSTLQTSPMDLTAPTAPAFPFHSRFLSPEMEGKGRISVLATVGCLLCSRD